MERSSHIKSFLPVLGYILLCAAGLSLYLFGFYEATRDSIILALVFSLLIAGFIYQSGREGRDLFKVKRIVLTLGMKSLTEFAAVLGAALLTFFLVRNLGMGAVLASSFVGLLGALALPTLAVPIFCGSFVGMASPAAYESYLCMVIAGSVAGLVFALGKGVFDGFGGKLGTMAFIGCLATSLLRGIPLQASPIPSWDVGLLILLYAMLGAVFAYALSIRLGKGPVLGSAFVGLAAALLLPPIYGAELGKSLAVVAFCSSFVGMSSAARLENEGIVAMAGLACGLAYMYASPWLGGAGGKLGTLALASSIAVSGLVRFYRSVGRRFPATGRNPS